MKKKRGPGSSPGRGLGLMVRDDAVAKGDEFGVGHVVLGIIGAPRADDEGPCAVGFEHVIEIGVEREAKFLFRFSAQRGRYV